MKKMDYVTLLKANFRRHKVSLCGIFFLIFIISLSLCTVLSVWQNSNTYVRQEMERLGFGAMTAWVSNVPDIEELADEVARHSEVERVGVQKLIYSDYRINGMDSDSEGQLVVYDPAQCPYKIFTESLTGYEENPIAIAPGEIYITPSLKSMFDVEIGEMIQFPIARQGVEKKFTVKGYFEDPFMGSSMIGMKSFLIGEEDYLDMAQIVKESSINALASAGFMLHIFQIEGSTLSPSVFNSLLNDETNLPGYIKFTHSSNAILGFMVLLQNVFTGFLIVFAAVLVVVCMIILGHSISSTIEQDYVNMGILKAMGMTSGALRKNQLLFYSIGILGGMLSGIAASLALITQLLKMTITTTGVSIPGALSIRLCGLSLGVILCLLFGFIHFKTSKVAKITPLSAIRRRGGYKQLKHRSIVPIGQKGLSFWLALRQLVTAKRQYISVCMITILLVFFIALIGRMNAWLGADGAGMMNAFNPAELDIGVQVMGDINREEIEDVIASYTGITDSYLLAMTNVSVNGIDYTANVISEPKRFQILEGRSSFAEDEIVITEFAAKDLNVKVGDSIKVAYRARSKSYVVSGIYQCANDMGNNIGMSREGFRQIGSESPRMWCIHYFLEDKSQQQNVMQALENRYGGNIHLHENTWPGLYSIITAMQLLTVFMYGIVTLFIFVVVVLTGSKMLYMEQKDLGIYKSLGFTAQHLQFAFALRFGVVSLIGSAAGILLSAVFADDIVSSLLRMSGISNFSSHLGAASMLLPAGSVVSLYFIFAYAAAGKIKKVDFTALLVE